MYYYQKIYLKGIVITMIAIPLLFSIILEIFHLSGMTDASVRNTIGHFADIPWMQYSVQLILGIIVTLIASKVFAKQMLKRPNQLFINNLLSTLVLWICFMFVGLLDDVFGESFTIDLGSIFTGWLIYGVVLFTIIALIHAVILYPILIYLRKKYIKKIGKP